MRPTSSSSRTAGWRSADEPPEVVLRALEVRKRRQARTARNALDHGVLRRTRPASHKPLGPLRVQEPHEPQSGGVLLRRRHDADAGGEHEVARVAGPEPVVPHRQVRIVREQVVEVVVVDETDLDVAATDRLDDARVVRDRASRRSTAGPAASSARGSRRRGGSSRRETPGMTRSWARCRSSPSSCAFVSPQTDCGSCAGVSALRVVDEHARAGARPDPAAARRREPRRDLADDRSAGAARAARAPRRGRACRAPATSRCRPDSRCPLRPAPSRARSRTRSGR